MARISTNATANRGGERAWRAVSLVISALSLACSAEAAPGGGDDQGPIAGLPGPSPTWQNDQGSAITLRAQDPGYVCSGSSAITVTIDNVDFQGTLQRRALTFSQAGQAHKIQFINDSQFVLDGNAAAPYSDAFVPDLQTGRWQLSGALQGELVVDTVIDPTFSATFTPPGQAATGAAGQFAPSNPDAAVYAGKITQLMFDGSAAQWQGDFIGASRVELSSGAASLTMVRTGCAP